MSHAKWKFAFLACADSEGADQPAQADLRIRWPPT